MRKESMTTFPSGTWKPKKLYMSQTPKNRVRRESVFRHVVGQVTHSDTPGAFTIGFVEAWEPLTANKPRVCNQVTSTVEHRPVRKKTVRQWEISSENIMDRVVKTIKAV